VSAADGSTSDFDGGQLPMMKTMVRGAMMPMGRLTGQPTVESFHSSTSLSAADSLERSRSNDDSDAAAQLEVTNAGQTILSSMPDFDAANAILARLAAIERYDDAVDQLLATADESSAVDQLLELLSTECRPVRSSIAR
jgi:hypothetical protein